MAESNNSLLALNTMVHMVTIKLTSTNYLLWRRQFVPLLESHQDLKGYFDGTLSAPAAQVRAGTELVPNPACKTWLSQDKLLPSLLYTSLTKECRAEVFNCTTAHDPWLAIQIPLT
jgi:alpha-N-arabinofuranosidase